jgi:serine/threonine protein kinase
MPKPHDEIGPYVLVRKLGKGSFGAVWLAERRSSLTITKFALKFPHDDEIDVDLIRREAQIWTLASGHPNVLPIIEANIYGEQIVIVSEYAPDGELTAWVRRQGPEVSDAIIVELLLGVLSGLRHLHERRIIHRDLKPANIIMQGRTPRIADFGMAHLLVSGSRTSRPVGTLPYMAPEALDGKRNEQTDLWSIGVIMYELVTARLPFPQNEITSLLAAIARVQIAPIVEEIHPLVRAVVNKALEKDISRRYRSANEMIKDLQHVAFTMEMERRNADQRTTSDSFLNEQSNRTDVSLVESRFLASTEIEHTQTMLSPRPASTERPANLPPVIRIGPSSKSSSETASIKSEDVTLSSNDKSSNQKGLKKIVAFLIVVGLVAIPISISLIKKLSDAKLGMQTEGPQARASTEPKGTPASKTGEPGPEQWVLKERLSGHTQMVNTVSFSPNGSLLASGGDDRSVKIWRVSDGQEVRTLYGNGDHIKRVAFSKDGNILVSTGRDGWIRWWDTTSWTAHELGPRARLEGTEVHFSANGKCLVVDFNYTTARLYSVPDLTLIRSFYYGKNKVIQAMDIAPDCGMVAAIAGVGVNELRIWKVSTGEEQHVTATRDESRLASEPSAVAFHPNGRLLFVSVRESVKLIDLPSLKVIGNLPVEAYNGVFVSPDQNLLACLSIPKLTMVEISTGKILQTLYFDNGRNYIKSIAFSSKGNLIAAPGENNQVILWQKPEP